MKDEVVVVTGASAGVGRAVVRALARDGARIGLIARGVERLEATAREVEALGGQALVLPLDVADADAVHAAADRVERELGPIDAWINNAMVTVFSPVQEITAAEFRRVMDVTFLGYVHGTQAALRHMRPRDRGAIVQVGSALAHRGIPLQSAYCAAKHAIEGFCESLRTELIHDGSAVRITQVHLPAINTPQFAWGRSKMPRKAQPVPPIYQPEVAARVIVRAARSPRRREVLLGLPTLAAIWGNRLVPGITDRWLAWKGWDGQMTGEPADVDRPDNLFAPVPGDHAARGAFSDRASEGAPLVLPGARLGVGLVAAGLGIGLALGLSR